MRKIDIRFSLLGCAGVEIALPDLRGGFIAR
jgi:hypothetical protein